MSSIMPKGTEVLIFQNNGYEEKKYITGVIKSNFVVNRELDYEGDLIYTVLGEDDNWYIGSYGYDDNSNTFFMTIDDYINYLELKLKSNNRRIEKIKNDNSTYITKIIELKEEKVSHKRIRKLKR